MRILFAIPHYFRPSSDGRHGSEGDAVRRREVLKSCLSWLHRSFGRRQLLAHSRHPSGLPANEALSADIDIVVCTTGGDHLLDGVPTGLFRHHATTAQPRLLGYECHEVLRDHLGRYDVYCYLEDDLILMDPLFFHKLRWFMEFAGEGAVLLPNRFEQSPRVPDCKLYVDGTTRDSGLAQRHQDRAADPVLSASLFGAELLFQRVSNAHSGCFFLTENQMRRFSEAPHFLDRDTGYWGPLESAATLGILRSFAVYKPARANAGFLEILHGDTRLLGVSPPPKA